MNGAGSGKLHRRDADAGKAPSAGTRPTFARHTRVNLGFEQPTSRGGGRGTPPPPNGNVPPREGDDPHEYPRRTRDGRRQKSAFLSIGGMLINVCGDRPCYSDDWSGP